jgi:acyl-CoA hydrolase
VIAQLNPRVPYTYGDAELPCDVIDYAIEAEAPLPSPPERSATKSSAVIGDRVAALIGDGATLQAGIGAVPDAVLAGLHGRRRLAVWVGGRVHSGFGGQTDFVVGALHSPGGQAIIALPSWHPKADVSTVVPRLDGPVTSFQHSYIVSEQGTAVIWGHDASGQAEQIIEHAAHPSVRQQLREAGGSLGVRLLRPLLVRSWRRDSCCRDTPFQPGPRPRSIGVGLGQPQLPAEFDGALGEIAQAAAAASRRQA